MAEVINSLFGVTPESLTADREAALQQRAMQYAQMDPFKRAAASMYTAGSQLGGAIGGMLGAQDPEMMRLTQRQSLLQQAQPTNAKGWSDLGSQLMQRGDIQGAQEAYSKAQALNKAAGEAEKTQSEIEKNKAAAEKDRRIPTPTDARTPEEKNAATYALTKGTVNSQEYKDAFAQRFAELTNKERKTQVVGVAKGSEVPVYEDDQGQFTYIKGADGKQIRQPYYGGVDRTTAKTTVTLPGQQVPQKEWLPFAEYLDKNPLFKKSASLISAAPAALETIRMSTSNDIAAVGFAPMMARMAGEEGALSANDVNRWLKTGGLDDRLVGSAVTFLTGRPTVAKKEQAEKYVSAMFRGALLEQKRTLQDKAKEFGYLESPNYKARLESIDAQLARFKKPSENKPSQAGAYSDDQVNAVLQKYQQPK